MLRMKLKHRQVDENGKVIYEVNGLIDILLNGGRIPSDINFEITEETILYNKYSKLFGSDKQLRNVSKQTTHEQNQNNWFMPKKYVELDLDEYFSKLIKTPEEIDRVGMELKCWEDKKFTDVLRFCIYFMDYAKENDIIIGVGRGSSCCSYLLYLIGLHRVDCIKYDLDITEFLK